VAISIALLDPMQTAVLYEWSFEEVERNSISIGRSEDNDIVVQDRRVSRSHAKIAFLAGELYVKSLGKNGCYVNNEKVEGVQICTNQALLRLGKCGPQLRIRLGTLETSRGVVIQARQPLPCSVY